MITNPVPNCARVRLVFEAAGRECGTDLWYQALTPPVNAGSLATLAARCRTVTNFSYAGVLASDCRLLRVEAQDYSSGPGLLVTHAIPLGYGFGGPARDSAIALRLFHEVDVPIKGHPFCSYVPGIPTTQIEGNFIDPSFAAGLAAAWDNYAVNLPIFGWAYVAVQRVHLRAPLPLGVVQLVRGTTVSSSAVYSRRYRLPSRP